VGAKRSRKNEHGQGAGTPGKEDGFRAVFDVSLAISKAKSVAYWPYWHIDLNAGSGWNDLVDCEGSPLVFLSAAIAARRPGPVRLFFCDHRPDAIRQLQERCEPLLEQLRVVTPGSTITYHGGDNADFLAAVRRIIVASGDRYPMGTFLSDANSPTQGFPFGQMVAFATAFPRIDAVLNLNLGVLRPGARAPQPGWRKHPTVVGMMNKIPRSIWWVRNPSRIGKHQFMALVGRNKDTGRRSFKDFYRADSPEGKLILERLKRVDVEQTLLFPEWESEYEP
jgi:hypothetical protein